MPLQYFLPKNSFFGTNKKMSKRLVGPCKDQKRKTCVQTNILHVSNLLLRRLTFLTPIVDWVRPPPPSVFSQITPVVRVLLHCVTAQSLLTLQDCYRLSPQGFQKLTVESISNVENMRGSPGGDEICRRVARDGNHRCWSLSWKHQHRHCCELVFILFVVVAVGKGMLR
jgi:hypothetical protein